MGRLKALPPRLSALPPRLGLGVHGDRREMTGKRDRRHEPQGKWHHLYCKARWQHLRMSVLKAANFTCVRCSSISRHPKGSDMHADHIVAHRGDEALFYDRSNLQCLCARCHNSDKQREERAAR
ncbi:HNH endonuclease [Mangrovicoccus ximenensis]|uniref:HNH endonuclease n=1 Tax=Mangrovicoccus ximenensis TaxID=1911570 RepID=UPI000D3C8F6C|nr:HNH endonuclease [Mangrovicoccus ximenensis]